MGADVKHGTERGSAGSSPSAGVLWQLTPVPTRHWSSTCVA